MPIKLKKAKGRKARAAKALSPVGAARKSGKPAVALVKARPVPAAAKTTGAKLRTTLPEADGFDIPTELVTGFGRTMGPRYFFSNDIPEKYNDTYLRAIPRDPLWLFAYWELSGQTVELMRRHVGEDVFDKATWVLRLLDVTDIEFDGSNAWRQTDIELSPFASSWYVKVWEPGRSYMLQVGIITPDTRFFSVVNSNSARMPRNEVSRVLDEEWASASTDELLRLSGHRRGAPAGASENSGGFFETASGVGAGLGSGSIL